jgi:4-hydroxy-tetrahydrodipicolinate synthase
MFRGVYTVLVTPFNSAGEVDYEGLRRNVEWQIQEGIHGLVVNGSTGEFASLEDYEREKTAVTVLNTVAGKIPVLVGASAEATQKAIYYAKSAKEMDAQGVLVLPSYYCKPNQEEIFYHFASIADAVDIPIMIYNNPFTTGVDIQPETVKRMVDYHPNLCYIKECTGDIKRFRQIQLLCGDKIKIFCGWEDLAFESFVMGAYGWISVIGNIIPKLAVELFVEVAEQKDLDKGWKIYKSMLPMLQFLEYRGKAPQTLKYCLERIGLVGGTVRLPRLPLSDEDKKDIDKMLKGLELL